MFYSLKGKIIGVEGNTVGLETAGGEGYMVHMSETAMVKLSRDEREVRIFVRLFVRDDAMEIFGFMDEEERKLFDMLNTVSGVGPRAAISILSLGATEQIRTSIASGQAQVLSKSFGIGKKTAERIIVELKDKVGEIGEAAADWDDDVYEALIKLGYRREDIKEAMKKIDPNLKTTGEKLKDAMKKMK
ncbi:MAG: Holliday junction branch migration protein RuvA [Candidatus Colwellbacteria bacterium]|nr:Holliday junction branch migration protein RuvA [Candidatus Colwellbacteria bacterium]